VISLEDEVFVFLLKDCIKHTYHIFKYFGMFRKSYFEIQYKGL